MQRLDNKPIPAGVTECRASIIMRNEGLRLPYLLDYYRRLGVQRFFIVDNGSNDGGPEFLLRQPDCHVFLTHQSFSAANCGIDWHNRLLRSYGENNWWLTNDADELLVYPDCEKTRLPDFCRKLEAEGAYALYALMLDMYSREPISATTCVPGEAFTDICPFFDVDYKFLPRQKAPFAPAPFPPLEPVGGPRLRLFYPEFAKGGTAAVARAKILRKIRALLKRFGINLNVPVAVPPILFKIPLFKHKPGLEIINSHVISPVTLATQTGVLLHFKFFADFHARAIQETTRGEHFDGASEYARYLKVLEHTPDLSLYHAKSARYSSASQLAMLGLMKV